MVRANGPNIRSVEDIKKNSKGKRVEYYNEKNVSINFHFCRKCNSASICVQEKLYNSIIKKVQLHL